MYFKIGFGILNVDWRMLDGRGSDRIGTCLMAKTIKVFFEQDEEDHLIMLWNNVPLSQSILVSGKAQVPTQPGCTCKLSFVALLFFHSTC